MILENKISPKKIIISVVFLIIAILIFFGGFYIFQGKKSLPVSTNFTEKNYLIQGVPYVGIHNHTGQNNFAFSDTVAAVSEILEYWNPGQNNFSDLSEYFRAKNREDSFIGLDQIQEYFEKQGFVAQKATLNIEDFGKYINSKVKTPLLLFLPLTKDQPMEIRYHPATLLIGINDSEKKLTSHDYWAGNNYEISYSDYQALWDRMRPDERNAFLIVQPLNFNEKIKEVSTRNNVPYAKRTEVMQNSEVMLRNFALGVTALASQDSKNARIYLDKVSNDSAYDSFLPPLFKVRTLAGLANERLIEKDYDKAIEYANSAIALDHDLNKPFKDFPGYEIGNNNPLRIGETNGPYRILGDIYLAKGDYSKASENYKKSLDIYPNDKNVRRKLNIADLKSANK